MTNRLAMTLAVAAGYVLGRTKKAKLAIGVGGMVLGKRLKLNPQQLTGLLSEQLKNNPQLGELRDQLRGDLQGVGKAATSALVTRQLDSLSDRLHDRTLGVQDRLAAGGDEDDDREDREDGEARGADREQDKPEDDAYEERASEPERRRPAKKAPAKKTAANKTPAKKTAAKKTAAQRAPAEKGARPAKKAAAPAGKAAKKTAARRTGGGGRG